MAPRRVQFLLLLFLGRVACEPLIDSRNFLRDVYPVLVVDAIDEDDASGGGDEITKGKVRGFAPPARAPALRYMRARQVPGDGACLFHALSAGLWLAANGTHHPLTPQTLKKQSLWLRCTAIDVLEDARNPRLYMGDSERMRASKLLKLAADLDGLTPAEYCAKLRLPHAWGGGPEIVALSNAMRRPIHVYELVWAIAEPPSKSLRQQSHNRFLFFRRRRSIPMKKPLRKKSTPRWCLQCIAEFGSPKFDSGHAPVHILSCDSRFPDLNPEQQLEQGNHFLLLFECAPGDSEAAAKLCGADDSEAAAIATEAASRLKRRLGDVADSPSEIQLAPFFEEHRRGKKTPLWRHFAKVAALTAPVVVATKRGGLRPRRHR